MKRFLTVKRELQDRSYAEETHEGSVSCEDELCWFAGNGELKGGSRLQEVNSYDRNRVNILQILKGFCMNLYNRWLEISDLTSFKHLRIELTSQIITN